MPCPAVDLLSFEETRRATSDSADRESRPATGVPDDDRIRLTVTAEFAWGFYIVP